MCGKEKGKQSFPFVSNGLYVICANDLPLFSGDKGSHVHGKNHPHSMWGIRSAPKKRQKTSKNFMQNGKPLKSI